MTEAATLAQDKADKIEAEVIEAAPGQQLTLAKGGPTSPLQPMSIEDAVTDRLLRDPNLPVEHVKEVLALRTQLYAQRRTERLDQAREDFFNEMAKVQAELKRVFRDKAGQRSRYATYEQLDRMVRPIAAEKHGFLTTFNTKPCDVPNHIIVTAKVARGLHVEDYETPPLYSDNKGPKGAPTEMNLIQATGSAWTYGRRYLTLSIWNIALTDDQTDDDGHAAGGGAAPGPISKEQIAELETLIKDSDTKLEQFLAYGKVESLAEIPAHQFASAKTLLEQKLALKRAKAKEAEKKAAAQKAAS